MDCDPLIPRQTAYRSEFNHFLKTSVEAVDLQVLLDCKPRVIESMIIGHIERLRDLEKLSYWTIQMHCAAIFHFFEMNFFEMNDVNLNAKKIKRFLPPDKSDHSNRPTHCREEINQILSKCDIRQDLKSLSCLWPQQIYVLMDYQGCA
jgi:hypothetical protein